MKLSKKILKHTLIIVVFIIIQVGVASIIHSITHKYVLMQAYYYEGDNFFSYLLNMQGFLGGLLAPLISITIFVLLMKFIVRFKPFWKTRFYQRAIIVFVTCFMIIFSAFMGPYIKEVINDYRAQRVNTYIEFLRKGDESDSAISSMPKYTEFQPLDFFSLVGISSVLELLIGVGYAVVNLLILTIVEGILKLVRKTKKV